MSRLAKLLLAAILYAALMYGAYRLAVWAYPLIGLWIIAVALAFALPIALWIDRNDKRKAQRLG